MNAALKRLILCLVGAVTFSAAVPASAAATDPHWSVQGGFVAIRTVNLPRLAHWYRDSLGFEIVMSQPAGPTLLRRGSAVLEMIETVVSPGDGQTSAAQDLAVAGPYKFGFVVDDFDKLVAGLNNRGVPLLGKVITSDVDGMRLLAIADPDGNLLQFFGR